MNRIAVAQELVKLAKELVGGREKNVKNAIAQAKANAKSFGKKYYVNSTTAGFYVESSPIRDGTLYEVSPDGKVKDMKK